MKRLLLGAILLLSTTNAFSQNNTIEGKWKMQNFDNTQFTFEKPRIEVFRCLGLAFEALEQGGNAPCILNAANEIAVARFLNEEIKFLQIAETVEKTLQKASFIAKPSLEELIASDTEARGLAASILL